MNEMKLSDFNYELPQELIAQDPLQAVRRLRGRTGGTG